MSVSCAAAWAATQTFPADNAAAGLPNLDAPTIYTAGGALPFVPVGSARFALDRGHLLPAVVADHVFGRKVVIDSPHGGNGRQLYLIDIGDTADTIQALFGSALIAATTPARPPAPPPSDPLSS